MSDDLVNQITMSCLLDKTLFEKMYNREKNNKPHKKDIKFYRKRLVNITKELLLNQCTENIPDIKCAFNNYVKTCIQYFKLRDTTDIIQQNYKDIDNLENSENSENSENLIFLNEEEREKIDSLILKTVKINSGLDNFVKRTVFKKQEYPPPQKQDINLGDPILRTKGIKKISKKENITNIYDGEKNENTKKEEGK